MNLKQKYHSSPRLVNPQFFILTAKTLSCKAFRLYVNPFFRLGASNSCCTSVSAEKFDTPILTPTGSRKLGKKYCAIGRNYPTNTFNLTLTAGAQRKKHNTVLVRFDDFVQARSQFSVLRLSQISTLEHTVLHPLPVRLQHFVNLCPALVFRNIVRNQNVHI